MRPARLQPPASRLDPALRRSRRQRGEGFSLIELMVVVAIIVILALLALPSVPEKVIRDRIAESLKLADIVKPKVASAWSTAGELPVDNVAAGLPAADKIVSDMISAVAVESGAIQITFGNQANPAIHGKMLTLRPAVVEDARIVPISWICADADVPTKMTVRGLNKTTVPARYLPVQCRTRAVGPPP